MRKRKPAPHRSDVAMWHELSGMPDNVTDEGVVVDAERRRRLRSEKDVLRSQIIGLRNGENPERVRNMARLAASYLLAGDVETARRYVNLARDLLARGEDPPEQGEPRPPR